MSNPNTKILITGASGFIGSHMTEQALICGYETWAAIRSTSNKHYLTDSRIHFLELDYTNKESLKASLQMHCQRHDGWDIIVHCAGATKCRYNKDFYEANYMTTIRFVEVLHDLAIIPRQFIFISTLGVYGPQHEVPPFRPITNADIPHPNTAYGRSKHATETYLMGLPNFPYVIFRPTGVYGPRDKDYQVLIDAIEHHIELRLGYQQQSITFVYVRDLVKAVFCAIEKRVSRRSYFVTDGNIYTASDFGQTVRKALNISFVTHITFPLWAGYITATLCDIIGKTLRKEFVLNRDKYRILKQRNWTCDINPLMRELGYIPQYNLRRGIEEMLRIKDKKS